MAKFDRGYRQKIVDEFLAATGANYFVPVDFLEWLEPQTDHRAWSIFFGKSDEDAAREYRLALARQFVSGLKITVRTSNTETGEQTTVKVPAFISPVSERKSGGGYVSVDVDDDAIRGELCRQAAAALESWLRRFSGVTEIVGVDVAAIRRIAVEISAHGVEDVDGTAKVAAE